MVRQLADLELALQQLVAEHRKLLASMDAQQAAMRVMDLNAMDVALNAQEASRLRISTLETKRRTVVSLLTRGVKVEAPVTLTKVAALYPQRRDALLKLRDELKDVATTIATRTKVAVKLAGAVERAGVYTKDGIPRVSGRIGIMEAVG